MGISPTHTLKLHMLSIHTHSLNATNISLCYSLEHTTRSFPSRNIAFGSCICFEEQSLLYCDSLRPIRYVMDPLFHSFGRVKNYNDTIHTNRFATTTHHALNTRVDEGIKSIV